MKLLSFEHGGVPSFGCVTPEGVIDLGRALAGRARDLKEVLAKEMLPAVKEVALSSGPRLALESLQLLPVVPNPGKIICVGLNHHDHVVETGRAIAAHPALFMRTLESQAAHEQDILLPPESAQLDFEGEIAVVIGKRGRRIAIEAAIDHIAGYACYNDGSARDWQAAATQWTAGKNFPRTGAFGPWLVTADEIPWDEPMTLVTRLNGKVMQQASTAQLIHSIPELIRHISTFTTLEPGDVIVTGTPGGVGFKRSPPVFLQSGDVVEVEVDRIGVLRNRVTCEVSEAKV